LNEGFGARFCHKLIGTERFHKKTTLISKNIDFNDFYIRYFSINKLL
jgi:hypothetical protein